MGDQDGINTAGNLLARADSDKGCMESSFRIFRFKQGAFHTTRSVQQYRNSRHVSRSCMRKGSLLFRMSPSKRRRARKLQDTSTCRWQNLCFDDDDSEKAHESLKFQDKTSQVMADSGFDSRLVRLSFHPGMLVGGCEIEPCIALVSLPAESLLSHWVVGLHGATPRYECWQIGRRE